MRIIDRVFFHHSGGWPNTSVAALERAHQRWNGGRDIEYHYVINGVAGVDRLHVCRPVASHGWHAGPKGNTNSIGICITGWNGDSAPREGMGWTDGQIVLGQSLLDALWLTHEIKWWGGHRDVKATICPGLEVHDIFT